MATPRRNAATDDTTTTTTEASAAGSSALTQAAEFARQQMLLAGQAAAAMYRASEGLHRAGMHYGERAALLQGQALENLRKAGTAAELVSVQSTLAVYHVQEGLRFWQDLALAMSALGGEVMRASSPAATADGPQAGSMQAAQETVAAAGSMMDAAMNAAAPMADVLQQMFTAPLRAATGASGHH